MIEIKTECILKIGIVWNNRGYVNTYEKSFIDYANAKEAYAQFLIWVKHEPDHLIEQFADWNDDNDDIVLQYRKYSKFKYDSVVLMPQITLRHTTVVEVTEIL